MSDVPQKLHLDKRAADLLDHGIGADDDLLTTEQLARWLGVSVQWLEIGRSRGYGPPWMRLGRRCRYARAAVRAWLAKRMHSSTQDYPDNDPTRRRGRQPGSKVVNGKVMPPQGQVSTEPSAKSSASAN
jgi:predicted DNA-binding transcriptional regulator AlpA